MKKKRTNNQSVYATTKEMEMIQFIKEHSDANSNSAVLRKGLYYLYDALQEKYSAKNTIAN